MKLDPNNPMMSTLRALLVFEIIITWLAFPGMLQVSDASLPMALTACGIETVLCLVGAARIKQPVGWWAGWLAQAGLLLLGLLTPWMYVMGIIFFVIWVTSVILGKRIEAKKKVGQ